MTSLPSQHPTLSLHLTDLTLTPLVTSSSSRSHLESLTSLTTTALTSQSAVQRVNLGSPQRIMVEYPDRGAVVLQSYLDPAREAAAAAAAASPSRPTTAATAASYSSSSGFDGNHLPDAATAAVASHSDRHYRPPTTERARTDDAPPVLVGVVVAGSADEAREARRAAARLERLGRDFQKEWANDDSARNTDEVHHP
jgi:hypothetical protein